MKSDKDALVIIPAYNERENIPEVLQHLEENCITDFADIMVINDASTDGMEWVVKEKKYPVISQIYNMGYGAALQTGYKYAVQHNYKYVIQMDGDGQHDALNLPRIYDELRRANEVGEYPDIVLGARFRKDSAPFPISLPKKIVYVMFRRIIKFLTGRKITDPTTGLQGLSRKAFLYYSGFNNYDDKYPDANILIKMMLLGFNVTEIPALMHPRIFGKSIHSGIKPFWYMLRVLYSIMIVLIQVKLLKMDEGAGSGNVEKI